MMMTQHTPGPWQAEIPKPVHKGHYAAGQTADITEAGSISAIARVPVFTNNWKANAHLIAAAPELLSTLYEAAEFYNEGRVWTRQFSEKVDAIIAKAEGEP